MHRALCCLLVLGACQPDPLIGLKPDAALPDDTDAVLQPVPDIRVTPDHLDFGAWLPACSSEPQAVWIENVGNADLDVTSIEVRGGGKLAFAMTGGVPRVLGPSEGIDATITFTPTDEVPYDQPWLEIKSTDADQPVVEVPLRGEGALTTVIEDLFLQEPADAVDVLFSIDGSGSMSDDIAALAQAFDTFITAFVALGLDYHVAVIPADPECPDFLGPVITPQTPDPRAEFTAQATKRPCGGEAAFGATMNALDPARLAGTNAGFLRPAANLAVVAISDEPEQTEGGGPLGCNPPFLSTGCLPVRTYTSWLAGLKGGNAGKVSFSGVVAPKTASLSGLIRCLDVLPAPRYHTAIQQTGGVYGQLCASNLGPFLNHLAKVAAGVDDTFALSRTPLAPDGSDLQVEVGGRSVSPGADDGYTYDPVTNTLSLHGSASPAPGEEVLVTYGASADCSN